MNPDGSGQMDLSNDPATSDFDPDWSPDGTKIAWARATETSDFDIWVMNADGTNQIQLTTDPGFDGYPSWSPDGTKIAFARSSGGDLADVYVMNADGSGETNLTNDPAADDWAPTWSPDGTRIAFTKYAGVDTEIYAMNADGSSPTNLTNDPAQRLRARRGRRTERRSPISRYNGFTTQPRSTPMNSDGSGQDESHERLCRRRRLADVVARWCKHCFHATSAPPPPPEGGEIYAMSADGSKPGELDQRPGRRLHAELVAGWDEDRIHPLVGQRGGEIYLHECRRQQPGQTSLTNDSTDDFGTRLVAGRHEDRLHYASATTTRRST